jgi:hypothetical protein
MGHSNFEGLSQDSIVLRNSIRKAYHPHEDAFYIGIWIDNISELIYDAFESVYDEVVFEEEYVREFLDSFYYLNSGIPYDVYVADTIRQMGAEFGYDELEPIMEAMEFESDFRLEEFEVANPLRDSPRLLPEEYTKEEQMYWQGVYQYFLPDCLRKAIDDYVKEHSENAGVIHPPMEYDLARVCINFQLEILNTLRPEEYTPQGAYEESWNETELAIDEEKFLAYHVVGDREWRVGYKDFNWWSACGSIPTPLDLGLELSKRAVEHYTGKPVENDITVLITYSPPDLNQKLLKSAIH